MKLAHLSIPLLAAGCTVMVNGKPRTIGGGGQPQQPAANAPVATTGGAQQQAPNQPAAAQQQPPAARPGTSIRLPATLTSTPLVTRIDGVAFDTTWGKTFGHGGSWPDCGSDMTSQPIASIQLDKPMAAMHLAVIGGSNDGFLLRRGDQRWTVCQTTVTGLQEGWQPGRYDIYPLSRYGRGAKGTFSVEVYDPAAQAPWGDGIKKVAISGKLAAPMFVEVSTSANRRVLRKEHAGWSCEHVALPDQPDLQLVLERPVPGLIVRPLPTPAKVVLRRELRDGKRPDKGCPKYRREVVSNTYAPSYESESELHFGRDDEGTYGISLGTADGTSATVTLMIFDASTKLEPLAQFPYAGDSGALERRWLGYYFPQLDVRTLGNADWVELERTAQLWTLAPKQTFVYAKLDLDKDIASGWGDAYPKKNEPLLVTGFNGDRVDVVAADGMTYTVKNTHLLLAPDGEAAPLAAPRPLPKLDLGDTIKRLPPSAKGLVTARDRRLDARQKCIDRTWAPYGRQLPSITRPSNVDIVYYESARTKNIRRAGEAAVDRACGDDARAKQLSEQERLKMAAEIEKARVKLLAQAQGK